MTEYEEKISASGILYDAKLGDIAYASYQYGIAINSAGLEYTMVDTGQKINELPLIHFVCRPKADINSSVITVQDSLDISTEFRVQQIMKIITGEINYIEEISKLQTQIEAMKSSKFWKLRKIWMKVKRKLGLTTEYTN